MFCEGHGTILGALKLAAIITAFPFAAFLIDIWYTNRLLREWHPGLEQELREKYYSWGDWRKSWSNWRAVPLGDRIFYWFIVSPSYYKYNPRFMAKLLLHIIYGVALFTMWFSYSEMTHAIPKGDILAILNLVITGVLAAICIGFYYAVERGRLPSISYVVVLGALVGSFMIAVPCYDPRDFIFIFAGLMCAFMLSRISVNWRSVYRMTHGQS